MKSNYLFGKKILIVDDEIDLLHMIVAILNGAGFVNIKTAGCIKEAITIADEFDPELAILDIMLPDGTGYDLLEHLQLTGDYPCLFLTALGEDENKLKGLAQGADDYIVKPFLPQELIYRITAILKRTYKNDHPIVKLQASEIDFERAEVSKNGEHIMLTAKEYALLKALHRNAGRIVTIDTLCEAAWGDNPFGYENSLVVHIRRIREKIEENPSKPVSLITVKGLGYKLIIRGK